MNNLTSKLFTNVINFAEASGVIANAADNLLGHILSEEKVNAARVYWKTGGCYFSPTVRRTISKCYRCVDLAGPDPCYHDGWVLCGKRC